MASNIQSSLEEKGIKNMTSSFYNNVQEDYILKDKYDKEYIRLFSRDPEYLFTYWEVNNKLYYENDPYLCLYQIDENTPVDIKINHMVSTCSTR